MSVNVAGTGDLFLAGSRWWGSSTVYGMSRSCWWWKQKSWRSGGTCAYSVFCCQRTMPFRVDDDEVGRARAKPRGDWVCTCGRDCVQGVERERDKGLSDEADWGSRARAVRHLPGLRLRNEW